MPRLSITLLILFLSQVILVAFAFKEELLLKPLPDEKVLAHFHFQTRAPSPSNSHAHLFPKAISQLVHKFKVQEMELSFTQGRWNYEQWGGYDPLSNMNAKPVGVELWAVFDVPLSQVDIYWNNFTNALSGLFCASLNSLKASPSLGFGSNSPKLRYGSLPREAVCTENLTPWLKLLPCRDKDGISILMHRSSIYRASYHSHRLHLTTVKSGQEELDSVTVLDQTLTVVLHSKTASREPSWSLGSLFGRKVVTRCVLAESSKVYVQLESLTEHDKEVYRLGFSVKPDTALHGSNSFLFMFDIEKYGDSKPFDLAFTWKLPSNWSCQQAPLLANRFLMGSGNERGAIAISLKSSQLFEKVSGRDLSDGSCTLQANVFQVFPWYIKVYYHTLRVFVDHKPASHVIKKIKVSPSTNKMSLGVMEMMLELPCRVQSAAIVLEFDKGFIHIDEYPPDANQGFDIPSALISFPNLHTRLEFQEEPSNSPLLSKLKENTLVRSYTEVLLVPWTTPDFSMPYNVIISTGLVFYLFHRIFFGLLYRRVGEEERSLESQGKKTGGLKQLLSRISAKTRGRATETPSLESTETGPLVLSYTFVSKSVLAVGVGIAAVWQYFYVD